MAIKMLKWALKHPNILIRLYTFSCFIWFIIVFVILIDVFLKGISSVEPTIAYLFGYIIAYIITLVIMGLSPMIPLYFLYYFRARSSTKVEAKMVATQKILDPYLASVKEKFNEADSYFKGEKGISWGPVIILCFDAVMSTLQRLIIDTKGIKPIEEMRKHRKLYFDSLISVLKEQEGILQLEDLKNLEILRDLRNRVVHEDYRPTKEHAIWASKISKVFVSKKYPEIF